MSGSPNWWKKIKQGLHAYRMGNLVTHNDVARNFLRDEFCEGHDADHFTMIIEDRAAAHAGLNAQAEFEFRAVRTRSDAVDHAMVSKQVLFEGVAFRLREAENEHFFTDLHQAA